MAERRQPGPRPDRAEDKAGAAVMSEFGHGFAGDLGGSRFSAKARSARPNSPRVIGEPPKLLVWTASQPAAR